MQNIEVTKPFGVSVRSWRKLRGFSQEEFAHRAGLHRTYVCDIERGSRNISLESIDKLARALEISTERLFSYDPDSGVPKKQRACDEEMVDILFVEDNPEDVNLTLQLLGKISNSVCVAKDGQEALDFLFGEGGFSHSRIVAQPRLVLLDLALPKISGFEVLRRLKADLARDRFQL